jgi:hypothetical protein
LRDAVETWRNLNELTEYGYLDELVARHAHLQRYLPRFLALPFRAERGGADLVEPPRDADSTGKKITALGVIFRSVAHRDTDPRVDQTFHWLKGCFVLVAHRDTDPRVDQTFHWLKGCFVLADLA